MTPDRAALALDALRVAVVLIAAVGGLFGAAGLLAWALDLDRPQAPSRPVRKPSTGRTDR